MNREEVAAIADRLVKQLENWHGAQDRGPLAKLRRGLSESTRHDAHFVLGRLFGPLAVGHPVFETVAGCFALHPVAGRPDIGSLGATMRKTMPDEKMREAAEPHARFRRLMSCATRDELCRLIPHAVRLARSRDVPVDYRALFVDLWFWGERVKVAWSKAYWSVPEEETRLSLAGVGSPVEEEAEAVEPEA